MSSTDVDTNKIIAACITNFTKDIAKAGNAKVRQFYEQFKTNHLSFYQQYLHQIYERNSKSKTFFVRTAPIPLDDFFVPLDGRVFSQKAKHSRLESNLIGNITIENLSKISDKIVLIGSGGSGKSIIMKGLTIQAIKAGLVPILIEIRDTNDSDESIIELLQKSFQFNKYQSSVEAIEYGLLNGKYCVLIDGFDEVSEAKRLKTLKDLTDIVNKYDKCMFIVSSRPDSDLISHKDFTCVTVADLTIEKAKALIFKSPYDLETKRSFNMKLDSGLYLSHKTFLSNPLLLSIMFITHTMNSQIPDKLSTFYNQAFEALFQRRDALKTMFQREFKATSDIQIFSKLFSCFSLLTFANDSYRFSRTSVLDYISKAAKITSIEVNPVDFLNDCVRCVCLLVEDSDHFEYSHRSFQEYFAALYVFNLPTEQYRRAINRFQQKNSNFIQLLIEINSEKFDHGYILTEMNDVFNKFDELPKDYPDKLKLFHLIKIDSIGGWTSISKTTGPVKESHVYSKFNIRSEFGIIIFLSKYWDIIDSKTLKTFHRTLHKNSNKKGYFYKGYIYIDSGIQRNVLFDDDDTQKIMSQISQNFQLDGDNFFEQFTDEQINDIIVLNPFLSLENLGIFNKEISDRVANRINSIEELFA